MKLLSFGEIIWDIFPNGEHIGGAPLNFAAHAAMQGADAYILSGIGDDALGKRAVSEIKKLGVKTEHICVCNRPTGQCRVMLDKNGIPSYTLMHDTAYDYISLPNITAADGFDVLYFGTLALRGENNIKTLHTLMKKTTFSHIFCDLNIRAPFYSRENILFCLENADIIKISDEELPTVSRTIFNRNFTTIEETAKEIFNRFCHRGDEKLIITKGADGSYAYQNGKEYYCNAVKTTTVSTVGAGDSFGATLLIQLLNGRELSDALAIASQVSAFVVSSEGAVPKYDVESFIASYLKHS